MRRYCSTRARRRQSARLAAIRNADPMEDVRRFLGREPRPQTADDGWPGGLPRPSAPKQRGTLTDTFNRQHTYLRISVTEKCSLRCTYCMPADGVPLQPQEAMLRSEEIVQLARWFVDAGVRKIRLTGGEPLVRKDIVELCKSLGSLEGLETLAMTTNGITLERKLPALLDSGLSAINISLDTLREDRFESLTRRRGLGRVLRALDAAVAASDRCRVKVNAVIQRGVNDDELADLAELTRDRPIELRFIEYMPFGGNAWERQKLVSYAEMHARLQRTFPSLRRCRSEDDPNLTSRTWAVDGFRGRLGFITSMTNQFCGTCNRLRLTADGNLKNCLFGAEEFSLRDALRHGASDETLRTIVGAVVDRKYPQLGGHASLEELVRGENRPMILIGG